MAKCEELKGKPECDFLEALEKVFNDAKYKNVARDFQIAHRITQRVTGAPKDEELVFVPTGKDHPKFEVVQRKKSAAARAAPQADPCCFWEWNGSFLECVGSC